MGIGQTAFPINIGMQTLAINTEKRCKRENTWNINFPNIKPYNSVKAQALV